MKRKQKEAMIAMGLKIAGLEEIVRRHKICIDAHNTRLSDHDESIEALDETAVQLSPCKCQAGELLKRIEKLDLEIVRADAFRQNHIERIVKLEKVKEDVRDLWCSQKAVVDEAIRRDVAVETLQQQVKEHDARLEFFFGTTGEINKELQVLQHQMVINTDRNERKITALENGMDKYVLLQVIERLENLEKRPKRTVLKTASGSRWGTNTAIATAITHLPDTPQANMLTVKKTAEKARKEYKKVMKKGASVG